MGRMTSFRNSLACFFAVKKRVNAFAYTWYHERGDMGNMGNIGDSYRNYLINLI